MYFVDRDRSCQSCGQINDIFFEDNAAPSMLEKRKYECSNCNQEIVYKTLKAVEVVSLIPEGAIISEKLRLQE